MNETNRDLTIRTACPKSWAELEGGDAKRFCSECSLHVHNSEALTRSEAHDLVLRANERAKERICMRIVKDEAGAPVYADSKKSLVRMAQWAVAAGASILAACRQDAVPEPAETVEPPAPEATMGMVFPEELGDVAYPVSSDDPAHPDNGAVSAGRTQVEPVEPRVELLGEAVAEELGKVIAPQDDGQ